jgi:pantoate kinase
LGTGFALCKVLGINLTYGQIGRIAHVAEIKCKTGLGTVGPLLLSGCILTVEPGAPGFAVIERLPISEDYRIVAGVFNPISTKGVLSSTEKREIVNKWGQKTVNRILAEPSLENFMRTSKEFALKTGFATERVRRLMENAEKAGAVGAAQNMVGEAVHALVLKDKVDDVVEVFKKVLQKKKILVAKIDFRGAHLVR